MSNGIHPGPGCPCDECIGSTLNSLEASATDNDDTAEMVGALRIALSRIRAEAAAPEAPPVRRCIPSDPCGSCAWCGYGVDPDAKPLPSAEPPQPPPRTRAEVDAEIAAAVRSWDWGNCNTGIRHPTLERLCSEPTHHTPAESPAIVDQIAEVLRVFDARKPLPQMSQVATAALALNHCLNVIDDIRGILARRAAARGTGGT